MTKPVITTRAGKGSALTWTEGDTNLTNLRDATITVTDGTNSKAIDLNGTITFTAGTNMSVAVNSSTGAVTITNTQSATTPAGSNQQIQFNNSGSFGASSSLTWSGTSLNAPILASTQSSGDEGGQIELALAATNSVLTGSVAIDINQSQLRIFETGGSNRGVYINLANAATGVGTNLLAGSATTLDGLSDVVITAPVLTNNVLRYDGTNWVNWAASALTVASATTATTATNANNINISTIDGNTSDTTMSVVLVGAQTTGNQAPHTDAGLTYNASTNTLTATTFSGTLSGSISQLDLNEAGSGDFFFLLSSSSAAGTVYPGVYSNISFNQASGLTVPSLISSGALTFKDTREALYNNGNSGAATITPNAANGSVQKYTLTGNITWNAFGTPIAGQSITMILVQDATGSRTLTSTGIKWSGGSKTLSTAANSIDIATVYYDGTNYYGSLAKGFA